MKVEQQKTEVVFWEWLSSSLAAADWRGKAAFRTLLRMPGEKARAGQLDHVMSTPPFDKQGKPRPAWQRKHHIDGLTHDASAAHLVGAADDALRRATWEKWARGGVLEMYFQLAGDMHPLLLADDLMPAASDEAARAIETLAALPGVALVESSPGNFQASLVAPRPLTGAERLAANRALARRLGADPGAIGASQIRRFPGSVNSKPALAEPFYSRVHGVPSPGVLPADWLTELIAEGLAIQVERDGLEEHPTAGGQRKRTGGLGAAASGGDQSQSGQDWALCKAAWHRSPRPSEDQLVGELVAICLARGDGQRLDYCQRTVRKSRPEWAAA